MDLLSGRGGRAVCRAALMISCGFAAATRMALGQISPGELSAPHAALEGLDNCTQCHVLGKAVSNDRCLSCHTEVKSRIASGSGYHGALRDKPCAECHSEHHGRDFQLVHFDKASFNHGATGYPLEGKHATVRCAECHKREFIRAQDIVKNRTLEEGGTYLGLSRQCLGCHADTHRGQLGTQCLTCHTMGGWKPASGFSHDRARYRLTGRHTDVACSSCHTPMHDDGKTPRYVDLDFRTCSSCHVDPHAGRFRKGCESCHTTDGWSEGAARNFSHAATRFPLRGRHAQVRCELCHVPVRTAGGKVVQLFAIARFQHCADCHADPHRGEFDRRTDGGACDACHTEGGFRPSRFNHATTRYPLEGKHAGVECRRCHGMTTSGGGGKRMPPDFRLGKYAHCMDCHKDAHGGQFARRADGGACESCHTVAGFVPATYGISDHRDARLALTGAHRAVACGECHPSGQIRAESTRRFRWPKEPSCQTCHADIHRGQFDGIMKESCGTCHTTEAWTRVRFSHEATRFPLRGKHLAVPCNACHKVVDAGTPEQRVRYAGTPVRCADCHGSSSAVQSGDEGMP